MKTTIKKQNQLVQSLSSETKRTNKTGIAPLAFFALFLLSLSFSSFAKNTKDELNLNSKEKSEIRSQLYEQIQFPNFLKEGKTTDESVNITFQIQNDGSIKVVRTDSKNELLNKYIEAELQKTNLGSLKVNEENVYKINIHFKLL